MSKNVVVYFPGYGHTHRLGGSVGLLVQSPSDADASAIPDGDLRTAEAYGQRVAEVAEKLRG